MTAATVLRLRNGDRVTGDLLRRENGKIYFRSPIFGEIAVSESNAVVVVEPDTPVESLVGLPPSEDPRYLSIAEPPPAAKGRWRGKLEFGYQQQSGRRDATTFSFRTDAERNKDALGTKANIRILYGEQDDSVSTERYDAALRFRYELSKHAFAQSLSSYTTDRIKKIDYNFEENIGVGYRLFKSLRHSANAGLGATLQAREVDGDTDDTGLLSELFQDYTYRFNGRLTFLQDASLLYSPRYVDNGESDMPNYRFRFNTALQGKVSERVSLNLRYEYEFDNTVPYTTEKQDQRITTSIGYAL